MKKNVFDIYFLLYPFLWTGEYLDFLLTSPVSIMINLIVLYK